MKYLGEAIGILLIIVVMVLIIDPETAGRKAGEFVAAYHAASEPQ